MNLVAAVLLRPNKPKELVLLDAVNLNDSIRRLLDTDTLIAVEEPANDLFYIWDGTGAVNKNMPPNMLALTLAPQDETLPVGNVLVIEGKTIREHRADLGTSS